MKNTLTVWKGSEAQKLSFEAPALLAHVLEKEDVDVAKPCGGHGKCGKCAVELFGCVSAPNEREQFFGTRLVCQAVLLGDAEVFLSGTVTMEQIELGGIALNGTFDQTTGDEGLFGVKEFGIIQSSAPPYGKFGAAVDIGTTTLALRIYDLSAGRIIGEFGAENPQRVFSADVMGRISAALAGDAKTLREKVENRLKAMTDHVLTSVGRSGEQVESFVITGNTTMLYLLVGQDVTCLSRAPFNAERLFDENLEFWGGQAYLPPCVSAFVGADTICAVLASGMCRSDNVELLCDIGTNGEIALWKEGTLYVTSTAAGSAFEGVGISCGCGSVCGAIDRVWAENGVLHFHTIGEAEPVGLCGSGLLDALAAFLELGAIDETGAIEGEFLTLTPELRLTKADIRAVQLAKAAVAAGIEMLMKISGTEQNQVSALYIAGSFGGHIDIPAAVQIGLLPTELETKVRFLGNGALAGAERLLLDGESRAEIRRIAAAAQPVNMGGDLNFNESFIDHLYFGSYSADT